MIKGTLEGHPPNAADDLVSYSAMSYFVYITSVMFLL
jgi:hypothetical protein